MYSGLVTSVIASSIQDAFDLSCQTDPDLIETDIDSFDPEQNGFKIHEIQVDDHQLITGTHVNDEMTYQICPIPNLPLSQVPGVAYGPDVMCGVEYVCEGKLEPILMCLLMASAPVVWFLDEVQVKMHITTISIVRPRIQGVGRYRCAVASQIVAEIVVDTDLSAHVIPRHVENIKIKEVVELINPDEGTSVEASGYRNVVSTNLSHHSPCIGSAALSSGDSLATENTSLSSGESHRIGSASLSRGDSQAIEKASLSSGESQSLEINADHLIIGDYMKKGGTAEVFRAKYFCRSVAAKRLTISGRRAQKRVLEAMRKELDVHAMLRCDAIVQLVGWCSSRDGKDAYIVTELVDGPDLDSLLFEPMHNELYNSLSTTQLNHMAKDMASAISYMHYSHSRPILHQDVKPGNFVLRLADFSVKLIDLGLGKVRHAQTIGQTASVSNLAGTWSYCPPEKLLHNRDGNCAGDVWGLGACLVELYTKQEIWDVPDDVDEFSFLQEKMAIQECPHALTKLKDKPDHPHVNIISDALDYKMQSRPSSNDICEYFAYCLLSPSD